MISIFKYRWTSVFRSSLSTALWGDICGHRFGVSMEGARPIVLSRHGDDCGATTDISGGGNAFFHSLPLGGAVIDTLIIASVILENLSVLRGPSCSNGINVRSDSVHCSISVLSELLSERVHSSTHVVPGGSKR